MPMRLPRILRASSGGKSSMRRPLKRTSPPTTRPGGSSSPMMAAPVSDLPAPDSPTTPSTSPGAMSNDTPSTAMSVRRRVGKATRRSRTERTGSLTGLFRCDEFHVHLVFRRHGKLEFALHGVGERLMVQGELDRLLPQGLPDVGDRRVSFGHVELGGEALDLAVQ